MGGRVARRPIWSVPPTARLFRGPNWDQYPVASFASCPAPPVIWDTTAWDRRDCVLLHRGKAVPPTRHFLNFRQPILPHQEATT